jgi:hypothetical protein
VFNLDDHSFHDPIDQFQDFDTSGVANGDDLGFTSAQDFSRILDDDDISFLSRSEDSFLSSRWGVKAPELEGAPWDNVEGQTPGTYFRDKSSRIGTLSGNAPEKERPNFERTTEFSSTMGFPPQTPLHFTPGKTELDSPSLKLLQEKFARMKMNGVHNLSSSETSSGYPQEITALQQNH